MGRVLRDRDRSYTYACLYRFGRIWPLNSPSEAARRPFALAGRYGATFIGTNGVEFSDNYIDVVDLQYGGKPYSADISDRPATDVALSPAGGLAWIACRRYRPDGTVTSRESPYCLVERADRRGRRVLDQGEDIGAKSLRLVSGARVVSWQSGGRTQRASLRGEAT